MSDNLSRTSGTTKAYFWKIVIFSVVLAVLANVFFGRFLSAKISTIPALNRLGVLSPQTPIVITQREQVRVSDSGDVQEAVVAAKSKVSTVLVVTDGKVKATGPAVNLAAEGVFLSTESVFSEVNVKYFVLLSDGRSSEIESLTKDPATGLVYFKAKLNNIPVASFITTANLMVGEKVAMLSNSNAVANTEVLLGIVSQTQNSLTAIIQADRPSRTFGLSFFGKSTFAQALINTSGDFIGIYDGEKVISGEVIKKSVALYFQNPAQIVRPKYGFSFSIISDFEKLILKMSGGLKIESVERNPKTGILPASQAGLLEKDIVVAINGEKISNLTQTEEMFEKYKNGDTIKLEVVRDSKPLVLSLKVGELK